MTETPQEQCRFCSSTETVLQRVCRPCREELRQWSHNKFRGSGIEVPPHEIDVMEREVLEQWREWVKTIDGGGGSYGPGRLEAIDKIFDAAWVGMKKAKSSRKSYNATLAKQLRNMAARLENGTL